MTDKPKNRAGRPRNPRPEDPRCAAVWDDPRAATALGKRLGVNRRTVECWRRGEHPPSATVLELLRNDAAKRGESER